MRASGGLPTNARWMRDFVASHPDYRHDSRIPDATLYDLMKHVSSKTVQTYRSVVKWN
jgi:glutamate--cysteine ligase catalytic subunit